MLQITTGKAKNILKLDATTLCVSYYNISFLQIVKCNKITTVIKIICTHNNIVTIKTPI